MTRKTGTVYMLGAMSDSLTALNDLSQVYVVRILKKALPSGCRFHSSCKTNN